MQRSSTAVTVCLMLFYGIIEGHVVDIHVSTPKEEGQRENDKKEQQKEKDSKTIDNPNSSPEDRQKALDRMIDNHQIA